jgi:glycosyltransferase involved in cell wall biosynthesis
VNGHFGAVVAGSHLRHDGVWQRPQQVLSRIATRVPVLFVEDPFIAQQDANAFIERGPFTVLRPLRRGSNIDVDVDEMTLRGVQQWLAGRVPLVWLYTPMMVRLASLGRAGLVYDCMDELSAFRFAPPQLRERETELLKRADLVFAGGRTLYERRRAYGPKVHLYPSGVDFERFAAAQRIAPHALFALLDRPVFGYFGVIDERIDLTILAEFSRRRLHTIMVGPTAKIDPRELPHSPYLHFTGQVAYERLPSFLAGFDVALMPFAQNDATREISPTKTPEYLAGRKPVVSTPVPDVVATYGEVVRLAETPEAFADAGEAAASRPDPQRLQRGEALARAASWEAVVAGMWADIVQSLAPP